jgi:lipopolysaccharide transport system permease protein
MTTDQLLPNVRSASAARRFRSGRRVTVIQRRQPGFFHAVAELWRYRRYSLYFGKIFLNQRIMRTWLGGLWLPLRPGMNIAAKVLVFGGLVGIPTGDIPYAVFFLAATAGWQLFNEAALWATRSLDLNRALLRQVHIPRLVVILGAAVPACVDFCINLGIAAVALLYYLLRAHTVYLHLNIWSPLEILAGLFLLLATGVGLGVITASRAARARDVRYFVMFSLGFVYWLTPIVYPFARIPNQYKPLAELNPVTGSMELFKVGLFHSEQFPPNALIISILAVVLLWVPGLWLFHRREVQDW